MIALAGSRWRAIIIRIACWAVFVGSVAYCGVSFAETWNAALGDGKCAGSLAPTASENAAWVLAIAAATVLFSFLTNRWLVAGLASLGFLTFFVTALSFAFGSCGSPRTPSIGDDVWTAAPFAGSSVVVAAVLAVPVWFVRAAVESYLRVRGGLTEGDAARRYGIPLLFLAGAILTPVVLVLVILRIFDSGELIWKILGLCLLGGLIALVVGIWKAIKGNRRRND